MSEASGRPAVIDAGTRDDHDAAAGRLVRGSRGGSRSWRWWDGGAWTGYTDQQYARRTVRIPSRSRRPARRREPTDPGRLDRHPRDGRGRRALGRRSTSSLRCSASRAATRSSLLVAQLGLWTGLVGACVDRGATPRHRAGSATSGSASEWVDLAARPRLRGRVRSSASGSSPSVITQHRDPAAPREPRRARCDRGTLTVVVIAVHRRRRRTVRRGAVLPRAAHERTGEPLRRRARHHPPGDRVRTRAPRPDRRCAATSACSCSSRRSARCSACCASATSGSAPACSRTRRTTRSSSTIAAHALAVPAPTSRRMHTRRVGIEAVARLLVAHGPRAPGPISSVGERTGTRGARTAARSTRRR